MATCLPCSDCTKGAGSIPLSCDKHHICRDCFISRGERRVIAQECATCESKGADPLPAGEQSKSGILIFVDNSNLWIEAKKLVAKENGLKTNEDPRLRIDIGKLTEVIADGRPVKQGILYGSEPPKLDTLWKKIEEHPVWEVKTKQRSLMSGKEKKVDTQLSVDVVSITRDISPENRSTLVVVTGDADMLPAVEEVQKHEGWSVEVYSWEHALSSEFRDLNSKGNSAFRAIPLNPYLKCITFIKRKFNLHKNRHLLQKFGIVFSMRPGVFQEHTHEPTEKWYLHIESIAKWPLKYCWLEEHSVLLVCPDEYTRKFDKEKFIDTIREQLSAHLGINNVQTYLQYSKNPDDRQWQLVQSRRKPKQWREHTEDKSDDSTNPGKSNPLRKTALCHYYPRCKKERKDCLFAHGEKDIDAFCTKCRESGHLKTNCRKKMRNSK